MHNLYALIKSQLQSPYDRHQSPRDAQLSFREKEVRIGDARPARPIVPELCLEIIVIESIGSRDFPEMAACGFLHCDFIDQQYICYLLKRTGALFMHRLEKSNTSDKPIKGTSSSIPARDAVSIKVGFLHSIFLTFELDIFNAFAYYSYRNFIFSYNH